MRIKVQYKDGTTGEVESYLLDDLIKSKKIKKFLRSRKWVIIGVDPIREIRDDTFEMPKKKTICPEKKKK